MMRINDYFQLMVERNASDFHLRSGTCPMFRVAGTMTPVNDQVLTNK
jgi:Tfp pilus assembly pilus retraction ATPase PilT